MQTLRNLLLTTAFILLIAAAASYMTALWIGEERLMLLVAAFGVPAFVVVLITLPLGVASAHREIEEAWVEIAAHCGGVTENARADTIIRASIDRHFPERLYGSCVRVVSGCSGGMDFRVLEWDDGERTRLLVFIGIPSDLCPRGLVTVHRTRWQRPAPISRRVSHDRRVSCS